ncbi:HlyD family secretion protein [Escherichia coli]
MNQKPARWCRYAAAKVARNKVRYRRPREFRQTCSPLSKYRRQYHNFRETDLKNIRSGTPATIRLMSDSGKTFEGKVDSIGYGVLPDDGGLVLGGLPKVSRSINWVRVAQRFPVKIMVDKPDPEMFRIGASAVANLEPQ